MNVITNTGLVSALGVDAATSLAAARAGLSRAAILKTVNADSEDYLAGSPVTGHALPCRIGDGFVGLPKALIMARAALDDLLSARSVTTMARMGIYVVLSDYFLLDGTSGDDVDATSDRMVRPSHEWRRATARFIEKLIDGGQFAATTLRRLYYGGHTGIVQALVDAQRDLDTDQVDTCVIGAVDSYVEPRVLRAAARAQMLKTAAVATGFLPGEAAAFFVLESQRRRSLNEQSVALTALATAKDPVNALMEQPPTGAGLASAVELCLKQMDSDERSRIGTVIGDLNGDERRAMEWGYCLVRLQSRDRVGNVRVVLPAMSFGETGCASGALALCHAVHAFHRGYAGSDRVVIVLSSDNGEKAALCLGN